MYYIDRINRILDHIEENLTGELSYAQMAEMMTMSVYEFRRIFAFIIGTPLSDYIRLRRLSAAVFDLQEGALSITEIAAKYPKGYVLVVVAGMNYAVYVESKGRDVLTSAEKLAETELPKMLRQLKDNIRKMV